LLRPFVFPQYPTFQQGSNFWNFTMSSFSTSPIPASTFAIPQGVGCEEMCSFSSPRTPEGYKQRLEARYAAGSKTLRKI